MALFSNMKSVLALEGMGKNSMYLQNRWDAGEQHGLVKTRHCKL